MRRLPGVERAVQTVSTRALAQCDLKHITVHGFACLSVCHLEHRQQSVSQMKTEDLQMTYDVVKEYKEHIDSVKKDRHLEEWLEVGQPHTDLFVALEP